VGAGDVASLEWGEIPSDELGRRLRQTTVISGLSHVFIASILFLLPHPAPAPLPPAIMVELMAALPAPPAPAPTPVPAAPAPVAVPKPKPKAEILPKKAPPAATKPRPKPAPKPIVRRPKPEELSYDDALAQLRKDLGETAPAVAPAKPDPATAAAAAAAASSNAGTARAGQIAGERSAWALAVVRHVRSLWIMPPEFRERDIATQLEITVAVDGSLVGAPRVVGSSGDSFYDDNAIRALERASPLPAPPEAGRYTIFFSPGAID